MEKRKQVMNMLMDKNGMELLDAIDSISPTPGGGSISALVGALGVCLVRMYGHLSVHKKKFSELDEKDQQVFIDAFETLSVYRNQLTDGIERDCNAYDTFMEAYRLSKSTQEEQKTRNQKLHMATLEAIDSPFSIMKASFEALQLCEKMMKNGNRMAISDLACGVIFLDAALQSASFNVMINLSSLSEEEKEKWENKITDLLTNSHKIKERIVNEVLKSL